MERIGLFVAVLGVALLLAMASGPNAVAAPASKVDTFTLDNGLRVVLRRTPGAADGAVAVVYGIGGEHDPEGRSGLAQVIARLYLLAGTEQMPPRERDDVRMRPPARGAWHGLGYEHFAGQDHTAFVRVLPSKDLATEVEDAADRMLGLRVREEEVEAARAQASSALSDAEGAIPATAAAEWARAAILEPPMRGRRLGTAKDLARVTPSEVKERLARLYRPKNAVLAVTGDFEIGPLRALVKKRFAPIPTGEPVGAPTAAPETPLAPEFTPKRTGAVTLERRARNGARGGSAALALAAPYLEPTKEYAAFLLLAARLYDAQSATPRGGAAPNSVMLAFDPWRDPTCLTLSRPVASASGAPPAAGALAAALEAASDGPVGAIDIVRTRGRMNIWFGVPPTEGSFADQPLVVAYGDARREALGVDGEAILKKLGSVKHADVLAAATRAHRVVIVLPKEE